MKKQHLLLVLFALSINSALSQPWPYFVSGTTSTYAPLANPISLNNGIVWTDTSTFNIPIPNFNFEVSGSPVDSIRVKGGHMVKFIAPPFNYHLQSFFIPASPPGYIFKDKGTISSLSPISYQISGPQGSQILKLEWESVGFNPLLTTDSSAYFNYQMWLFEIDNHIELHSGPIDTIGVDPQLKPYVRFFCTPSQMVVWAIGDPAAPVAYWTPNWAPLFDNLYKFPDEGTVIVFNPNPLYIGLPSEVTILKTRLFPNPLITESTLQVSATLLNATLSIYNSQGVKFKEVKNINGRNIIIHRNHLSPHIYYYNLITKSGIESAGKFLVAN